MSCPNMCYVNPGNGHGALNTERQCPPPLHERDDKMRGQKGLLLDFDKCLPWWRSFGRCGFTVGSLAASVISLFFCVCLLIFEIGSHYAALTGPTQHRPVLNLQRSVCLCLVRARIKYKYHSIFPPSPCSTSSFPSSHLPHPFLFPFSSDSRES